jgi:ubiquitin-activating enzyme E1
VLKACTGKGFPIHQHFFFDATEVLSNVEALDFNNMNNIEEFGPKGSRYDAQVAVLGRTLSEQIHGLNYFLVGAGAIGCEILKIWAMMGLGAGPKGNIHLTDMDLIQKVNLPLQFLYREKDIQVFPSPYPHPYPYTETQIENGSRGSESAEPECKYPCLQYSC